MVKKAMGEIQRQRGQLEEYRKRVRLVICAQIISLVGLALTCVVARQNATLEKALVDSDERAADLEDQLTNSSSSTPPAEVPPAMLSLWVLVLHAGCHGFLKRWLSDARDGVAGCFHGSSRR